MNVNKENSENMEKRRRGGEKERVETDMLEVPFYWKQSEGK